jgi:hypothetical protein
MDERRRTIRVLEEQRQKNLLFRTRTLEELGKDLAERLGEALPGNQGEDYHRFKQEIADSEASIGVIRSALKRIKELDEEISVKRLEKADRKEEAAALYLQLGQYVLGGNIPDSGLANELKALKRQRDLFLERDLSCRERLRNIEDAGWFSRNIQTLVINSSLKKNQRQLDKLHCQAGEIYARLDTVQTEPDDGFSIILRDTRAKWQNLAELDEGIEALEQEKAKIQLSFGFKEKPARHIQILEEKTMRRNEDLRKLYLQVAEGAPSVLQDSLADGDKAALEKARRYGESAEAGSREIERIEAEIAIDKEKEKIAKLERAVSGQKNRAANSEKNIGELNHKIAEAQRRIEALKNQE